MTDKIIIDGKNKECKILFSCKHIDDSAAFDLIRKGIKITTENAPVGDFELMLIENTNSPYGFSSICKRNNNKDVWEYSGFGHSGACSIVTALLKQLARKTEECEKLKKDLATKCGKDYINEIQDIQMKYECHQKSLGMCWWGKYGKDTECIGIRECHKKELEVIQQLETQLQAEQQKYADLYDAFCQATKPSPTMTRMYARFNRYEQTLKEIKEIAVLSQAHNDKDYLQKANIEILQKCEAIND
ncbi:MAG: hypothetical protein NC191_06995 [Muribaculaceae bacterium]|nr:hypothetical protein [Muribaculaceae bacterium]